MKAQRLFLAVILIPTLLGSLFGLTQLALAMNSATPITNLPVGSTATHKLHYWAEGRGLAVKFDNVESCTQSPPMETCIDLEKTGPETAEPGETVTYHFWVKNCGNVTLSGKVYDPLFGDDPIWSGDLEPDKVVEFDITYTLPNDYCSNLPNNAWTIGLPLGCPEVRDDDSWAVMIVCGLESSPSIAVEKYVSVNEQASWEDADLPPGPEGLEGSNVYFKFVVTNDGNVPLTNITLEDSDFDVSGYTVPNELEAGESFECVIGPFDDIRGQHTNTGTATGHYGEEAYSDEDDASVTVTDPEASIAVTKTADPTEVPEPGDAVEFTVLVENTSDADSVTITSLTDSIYDDLTTLSGSTCQAGLTIAAGDGCECTFSAEVTGNAGDTRSSVVTASGTDDDGHPVAASDDATVTITDVPSSIEVTKTADSTEVPEPGDTIEFTVLVENTSDADSVTITSLTDSIYGDLTTLSGSTCQAGLTIAAGDGCECTFSAEVTGSAGHTETSLVTASGTDDDGTPITANDEATITITDVPSSIEMTKTADPTEVPEPGDTVEFTVLVENTGDADSVTITSLTDSIYGDLTTLSGSTCQAGLTIAAGDGYECTFSATVTGNAGDTKASVVTASGTDDDGNSVTASDEATVTITNAPSSIEVAETADPTEVPESTDPTAVPETADPTEVPESADTGTGVIAASGTDGNGTPVAPGEEAAVMVASARPGCTYTQGYWKNHPDAWPVDELVLGNRTYYKTELTDLLSTPVGKDGSLMLAHQLIAVELNIANGTGPTGVAATIVEADQWMSDNADRDGRLPYGIRSDSPAGREAINLADVLDNYNKGIVGPGHCDDEAGWDDADWLYRGSITTSRDTDAHPAPSPLQRAALMVLVIASATGLAVAGLVAVTGLVGVAWLLRRRKPL